jgi:AmmeMemoRadiSam system protein A
MAHSVFTMLEDRDKGDLLEVARESIARGLQEREGTLPARAWSPGLLEWRATFTTLMLNGELRGCCGTIEAQRPLVEDVWRTAWNSAYADPRFWPVTPEEAGSLEISISVLSALEPLPARSDTELLACLEPGVDGLVLQYGARSATFLPSVWKSLPDPRDFLDQLKRKAGWSYTASAWLQDMIAFRYSTEVISQRRAEPNRDASRKAPCSLSIIP